jgi:hypothetical protein
METNILANIEKYKINPLEEILEAPTFCLINNMPSLTAGNFSLINGKKKAGKTFLLGGLVASTINNSLQLNAIKGCLPDDKRNILYFDTEQSPFHATRSIKRICALAGDTNPGNLYPFGLRQLNPEERLKFIEHVITLTPNVGIVAIDGIRDLLTRGINDESEATSLTSLFLKWSCELNIHIILLLHQNKNDLNPRGHIGSEVVNKAETIISVTKGDESDVFIVSCEDSRDKAFDDFSFKISDEGLPMPCELPDHKIRKVTDPSFIPGEKHLEVLSTLFKDGLEYNYGELRVNLMQEFNIGRDASEKFISFYKDKDWITKEQEGKCSIYRFNTNASSFFYNPN